MRTLVSALSIALATAAAQPPPEHWVRHVIAEGFVNQTAVAADFTGDGRLDVITGDITAKSERTLLYVAPRWTAVTLHSGIRTIHGAVIDVNGDGRQDFIGARYHPGLVYWLECPSGAARKPWPYRVIDDAAREGVDGVHGLLAADVDRDGKLDLIAGSGQPKGAVPDSLVWFAIGPDRGKGPSWERFAFADRNAPGLSHYLGIGDVDGDGRPDIASAAKDSPGGNWFAWWRQPANPRGPWEKNLIAGNQLGATNILIADFNGDRKADFVGSRGHSAGLVWYEAPAWRPHEMAQSLKGVHALGTGDIDGDGDTDIAAVAKDSRVAAWFENDGRGGFRQNTIYGDQSAYDLRLVDMDRDGDLDLLVAGFESRNVVWYENRLPRR